MTLIEILVVLGIIALLTGLLVPTLTVVKNTAKEAKQNAQFNAIDLAMVTFKNDYGDYPPSSYDSGDDYCGAQKLAEALLGLDLLGFHPQSDFNADGYTDEGVFVYDTGNQLYLDQRKGPYLESDTANAFRLLDIQDVSGTGLYSYMSSTLLSGNYVLCDVFAKKEVIIPTEMSGNNIVSSKKIKAGSPILYYKANTSLKIIDEIYEAVDNITLLELVDMMDGIYQPLANDDVFYDSITDPKTSLSAIPRPYNADSYILISAGLDGIYGTPDDIRNFGN